MKQTFILALLSILLLPLTQAQVKPIAHRGYWKTEGSAQNSLTSITKADAIGVYGCEFDVWITADGKLVVNHDRKFKGVDMTTATFAEVRKLRLDNGEPLPSLDEYLKLAAQKPNLRFVLELKSPLSVKLEDEAAEKIVKALKKHKMTERTDLIAFSINACLTLKKLSPDSKIYYLDGDLSPKKIRKLGLAGIDYSLYTLKQHPEWIKEAQELGLEVNVWTVNREEDMQYFIQAGVDYITTDHPEQLQKLLAR